MQFQAQTQDLTAHMSKIAASKPDAVIVQTVFAATNLSIKQGREVGLKADIITSRTGRCFQISGPRWARPVSASSIRPSPIPR